MQRKLDDDQIGVLSHLAQCLVDGRGFIVINESKDGETEMVTSLTNEGVAIMLRILVDSGEGAFARDDKWLN